MLPEYDIPDMVHDLSHLMVTYTGAYVCLVSSELALCDIVIDWIQNGNPPSWAPGPILLFNSVNIEFMFAINIILLSSYTNNLIVLE